MSDPCNRAMTQYSRGDIDRALTNISRCQKSVKQKMRKYKGQPEVLNQLRLQLSRAYHFEGQVYYSQQNPGKAFGGFSQAKRLLESVPSSKEKFAILGQVNYSLGMIALIRNKLERAIGLFQDAKDNYFEADMGEYALEVLFRLGKITRQLGNHDSAIEYFQEVNQNRKLIKDKTERRNLEALALLEEGKTIKEIGEDSPEKLFKKAKKLYSKTKNLKGEAECLIELGSLLEKEKPDTARDHYLEALDIGKTEDDPEIKGLALTRLGIMSLKSGEFEQGKQKLLEGLKYRTEAGDKTGTAQTLVELSRISLISARSEEDLSNAKKFAEQALGLYRETGSQYGQATTLELLGSILARQRNYEESVGVIKEGRDLFRKYNDLDGEARMLTQLGLVYDGLGDPQEAIYVLEKSLKIFERTGNLQGKAEALHVLAIQLKEDPNRAVELLQESKQLYQQIFGNNKQTQVIISAIEKTIESLQN